MFVFCHTGLWLVRDKCIHDMVVLLLEWFSLCKAQQPWGWKHWERAAQRTMGSQLSCAQMRKGSHLSSLGLNGEPLPIN